MTKERHKELSSKRIWELTAEEYIELNSPSGLGKSGFIQVGNALMAIKIARLENERVEIRKAIFKNGL